MNPYLKERQSQTISDDSNVAIWTYINLFIGFVVIFLSGIATNPGNTSSPNVNPSNFSFADQEIYEKPMIVAYARFDIEQILKDVQTFSRAEQLSVESRIVYLQVIGPYNSAVETRTEGLKRAQAISLRLNSSRSNIFRNASTTLSVSNGIPVNSFVLKITFSTSSGR